MLRHLKRDLSRFLADQSGSPAVEFALAAPILVLVLVGSADIGMAVRHRADLFNAARSGLQYAIYHPDDKAGIKNAVLDANNSPVTGADKFTVTVTNKCLCVGNINLTDSDGTGNCETAASCGASGNQEQYTYIDVARTYSMMLKYPGITDPVKFTGTVAVLTKKK